MNQKTVPRMQHRRLLSDALDVTVERRGSRVTRANTHQKVVFKARTETWGRRLKPDLCFYSPLNNLVVVVVCVNLEIKIFIRICLSHFHRFLPRT